VEPILTHLAEQVDGGISLAESSSDGDGGDGAAQAPPFVWLLHTWGALQPVMQALEALSQAVGTMCLAEAAHPPPSEADEQAPTSGSSDVNPSSAMTLDRRLAGLMTDLCESSACRSASRDTLDHQVQSLGPHVRAEFAENACLLHGPPCTALSSVLKHLFTACAGKQLICAPGDSWPTATSAAAEPLLCLFEALGTSQCLLWRYHCAAPSLQLAASDSRPTPMEALLAQAETLAARLLESTQRSEAAKAAEQHAGVQAAQAELAASLAADGSRGGGQQRLLQLAVAAGKWVHVLVAMPRTARDTEPGKQLIGFAHTMLKLCYHEAAKAQERAGAGDAAEKCR
jgi:hypothetical protein